MNEKSIRIFVALEIMWPRQSFSFFKWSFMYIFYAGYGQGMDGLTHQFFVSNS